MKKQNNLLLNFPAAVTRFLFLPFLLLAAVNGFAQMDKWILNPNEINFGGGTSNPVTTGASIPYKVENAVYKEGSLLFYANDGAVYGPGGNYMGQFSNLPFAMLKEIAIAPGPGTCGNYCLFWLETNPLAGLEFFYQEVLVESGYVWLGQSGEIGDGTLYGNSGGIAISHIIEGTQADRDIYIVAFDAVRRYRLNALGVTLQQTIPYQSGSSDFIWEADLSHDGKWLGWGKGNEIFAMETASPNTVYSFPVGDYSTEITGVEFSADNVHLYFSDSQLGLRRWQIGSSFINQLSEANTYRYTQLEMALDGYIYAVRDDGVLGRVQNLSVQQSPLGLAVYSSVAPPASLGEYYYALPDQIDGGDYSLFLGVQALAFEDYRVNGEEVFDFIDQNHPPLLVYNCNSINLETVLSGTPTEYSIHVYSVDPVSGQQITGPGYLDFTTGSGGVPPSSIDLRCLEDSQCELFNYAVAAGHFTFAVEMTIKNRCETVSRLGYIEVNDAPPAAQINLEVNKGDGLPGCPASHDISFPCLTGIYSTGISLSNSQGEITYYQLVIEEVHCENGEVIDLVYSGPQVEVNGVSGLAYLALNGLVIDGNTGYFLDEAWIGRCLKITITVGNACGSSTDYTYLKFDGAYFEDPGSGNRSLGQPESAVPGSKGLSLKAFPNPFSREFAILVGMPEEGIATVAVFDAAGQAVAVPCQEALLLAGEHRFGLDGLNFPSGLYTVQMRTEKTSSILRIVKID